ncbi:hypothetical protein [Cupriavidus lacunae]|uniref:hypothetical protein n=1 Tax=Cupriavidus lacunae TaxID=2666307 RepID=UPI001FCA3E0F|nr:hypothetical protein [Cupriavidus lacunae]
MTLEWLHRGKPSLLDVVSGAIASQVAITPACGYVGPMGALAVGLVVSPCCTVAIEKLNPARIRRLLLTCSVFTALADWWAAYSRQCSLSPR